jgi:hypothetical protein
MAVGAGPRPLFVAEGDAALTQIVGRHLDGNAIPGKDPDTVLAHLPGGMRQDLVIVVEMGNSSTTVP